MVALGAVQRLVQVAEEVDDEGERVVELALLLVAVCVERPPGRAVQDVAETFDGRDDAIAIACRATVVRLRVELLFVEGNVNEVPLRRFRPVFRFTARRARYDAAFAGVFDLVGPGRYVNDLFAFEDGKHVLLGARRQQRVGDECRDLMPLGAPGHRRARQQCSQTYQCD